MPTIIRGQITNLSGTTRKHKVCLCPNTISDPEGADSVIVSGETTDASGNYEICVDDIASGSYKISVDGIWLSSGTINVTADVLNTGKNVALGTPPALLSSSPYPVGTNDVVVAGYSLKPRGTGHSVKLFASTATDPTVNGIKNGTTNATSYYRFLYVTPGTYKIAIDSQWCSPATITISGTDDVERHSIKLP
jgi:hypothetical protein